MGLLSLLSGADFAKRAGELFASMYAEMTGYPPSGTAVTCVEKCARTMIVFAGSGQERKNGVARLSSDIDEFAAAVAYDEITIACGLANLLVVSSKSNRKPAMGYAWAHEVIESKTMVYCP